MISKIHFKNDHLFANWDICVEKRLLLGLIVRLRFIQLLYGN